MFGFLVFLSGVLYTQLIYCPLLILWIALTGRTSAFNTGKHLTTSFFRVKLRVLKTSAKFEPGCVYLSNHRSWADFFVDQAVCFGAAYLSRKLVIVGTPSSSYYAYLSKSTIFFKRKKGVDRKKLFELWDKEWESRNKKREGKKPFGLIVYPEGTRNQKDKPLKLKTGVLQYSYEYKKPVQIVMTSGKEKVLNEKKFGGGFGETCVVNYSAVIHPEDFENFDEFKALVSQRFTEEWKNVYNISSLEEDTVKYDLKQAGKEVKFEQVPGRSRVYFLRFVLILIIVAILFLLNFYEVIDLEDLI
eukprot:maker-scaffold_18-snap-gene-1.2-mRNA-1 protein AED:0.14 eAED:0.14 QI:60/1/1/1/1/1/2/90/301